MEDCGGFLFGLPGQGTEQHLWVKPSSLQLSVGDHIRQPMNEPKQVREVVMLGVVNLFK